ncbi:MAG: hypothetical protein WCG99_00590 [Candidatus Berkelbacteria bacterium]
MPEHYLGREEEKSLMSPEEISASDRRANAGWEQEKAAREVGIIQQEGAKFEEYLGADSDRRVDMLVAGDTGNLQTLYGEGLPSQYQVWEHDGLAGWVKPHNEFKDLAAEYVGVSEGWGQLHSYSFGPECIEAAKQFLAVYDENAERIIAKSPILQKMLAPLQGNHEITPEDLDMVDKFARANGSSGAGHFSNMMGRAKTLEDYVQNRGAKAAYEVMLDGPFGKAFRKAVMEYETPEGFAEYKTKLEGSFQGLEQVMGKEKEK